MVPEWGFVHMLHLAMSFIICPQKPQTKNNKKGDIDFFSPFYSLYLCYHIVAVMVKVEILLNITYHLFYSYNVSFSVTVVC